jgi:hypothetical protein
MLRFQQQSQRLVTPAAAAWAQSLSSCKGVMILLTRVSWSCHTHVRIHTRATQSGLAEREYLDNLIINVNRVNHEILLDLRPSVGIRGYLEVSGWHVQLQIICAIADFYILYWSIPKRHFAYPIYTNAHFLCFGGKNWFKFTWNICENYTNLGQQEAHVNHQHNHKSHLHKFFTSERASLLSVLVRYLHYFKNVSRGHRFMSAEIDCLRKIIEDIPP